MNDDEAVLLGLAGLWLLMKYEFDVIQPITRASEKAGLSAYEWLHSDQGHKRDLPGHQWTRQKVLDLVTRAGFPDPKLAAAIVFAESGGVPGAVTRSSRENSIGLFQINTMAWPQYSEDELKDPVKNAAAALHISRNGTHWKPWGAYTNGSYLKFRTGILAP